MENWFKPEEDKPYDDQTVLVIQELSDSGVPLICYYSEDEDTFILLGTHWEVYVQAKYWMPIPEFPKEM